VRNPEGKRQLKKPKHRWDLNIVMDVREMGCRRMDYINLAQDRD
jgi:hypothetical protein